MIRIYKSPPPVGLRAYLVDKNIKTEDGLLAHSYEEENGFSFREAYKKCGEGETEYCYTSPQGDSAFTELRKQLLKEQKYVCCYCGQSLSNNVLEMKTEHFLPKNSNASKYGADKVNEWSSKQLDYSNLLACCLGNQDSQKENHCDSSKKDDALFHIINPASSNFRNALEYRVYPNRKEVTVHAKIGIQNRDEIEKEINNILNLNEQGLKQKRFNQWNILITNVLQNRWTRAKVQQCYDDYSTRTERYVAFPAFILGYLADKLAKMP
jgi:uncharacterized protein (TIGR02646 family)